jgi:hypothetical protein
VRHRRPIEPRLINQLLDVEDKKLKATLKDPIVKKLPRTASVVYEPTWRPSTKRIEVLFGYKIDGGYVVDMPASDDGNTKRESRPAGPVPVRYGIYFGVRYTLEGDRVVAEERFAPRVPYGGWRHREWTRLRRCRRWLRRKSQTAPAGWVITSPKSFVSSGAPRQPGPALPSQLG